MEATAIQVMLPDRAMKILAAYLRPSRLLIGSEHTACVCGGLPVLLAGDLNAKHVDRNSRLSAGRGNSHMIMRMETPV